MTVVAVGAGLTGSDVGGVPEEEAARDLFFHRSASGLLIKLFGNRNPHTISCFHSNKMMKENSEVSLPKLWLPLLIMQSVFMPMLDVCIWFPLPSPATAPEMLVGIS